MSTTLPSTSISFSHYRTAIGKSNNVPIKFSEMYGFASDTPAVGALNAGILRGKTKKVILTDIVPQDDWSGSTPVSGTLYGGAFMEYPGTSVVQLNMSHGLTTGSGLVWTPASVPTQWSFKNSWTQISSTAGGTDYSAFVGYVILYETTAYNVTQPASISAMKGYAVSFSTSSVQIYRDGVSQASANIGFAWYNVYNAHVLYQIIFDNGTFHIQTALNYTPLATRLTWTDPNYTTIINRTGASYFGLHRFKDPSATYIGPTKRAGYPLMWKSGLIGAITATVIPAISSLTATTTITLSNYFSNPMGGTVTYDFSTGGNPQNNGSISGGVLTLTAANRGLTYTVTVRATNTYDGVATTTVSVTEPSFNIVPQDDWNSSPMPNGGTSYGIAAMEFTGSAESRYNMRNTAASGLVWTVASLPSQWIMYNNYRIHAGSSSNITMAYVFFYETTNYSVTTPASVANMKGYAVEFVSGTTPTIRLYRDGVQVATVTLDVYTWYSTGSPGHFLYHIVFNSGTFTIRTGVFTYTVNRDRIIWTDPDYATIINRTGAKYHGLHRFQDASGIWLGPANSAGYPLIWRSGLS